MVDDSVSGFGFPAICRKKVTAAFDGGRLTSDGGVLLLAQAERAMGIAGRLAGCIADPRDQSRVVHDLADKAGSAEHIYDTLYCARGQAENLIKLHKAQLKSDRTSCRSANANQMRLFLHTAAYWLMWTVRQALPENAALRTAEFATIRLRLIKVAARIVETATRVRIALASACPDAALFRHVAVSLRAASP